MGVVREWGCGVRDLCRKEAILIAGRSNAYRGDSSAVVWVSKFRNFIVIFRAEATELNSRKLFRVAL